jgi:hypothetical protein
MLNVTAALAPLGVTVVDGIGEQRVLRDSDDVLNDLEVLLHDCRGAHCVCVSQLAKVAV